MEYVFVTTKYILFSFAALLLSLLVAPFVCVSVLSALINAFQACIHLVHGLEENLEGKK